jgi:hypothetical protein
MDDIDRSAIKIIQPCLSSIGRRMIIGLAEPSREVFLSIGEGGTFCAHALQNFIQIYQEFRFNVKRGVEQMYWPVLMHLLKERKTR